MLEACGLKTPHASNGKQEEEEEEEQQQQHYNHRAKKCYHEADTRIKHVHIYKTSVRSFFSFTCTFISFLVLSLILNDNDLCANEFCTI